nr:right-handed parallel beta-helix repeat-containing protein [uncultured Desulfuromonas sp.]
MSRWAGVLLGLCLVFTAEMSAAAMVEVGQLSALRTALQQAGPGTTIRVLPGTYAGGIKAHNLQGTAQNPITITAVDSRLPPVFTGGTEGLKLSSCAYIKVQHLIFDGFSHNGINIDDANKKVASHHVVFDAVAVLNTGSRGNHDAIKFSGVHDFIVRHARIEGWGGSAVDLVGCRNGAIENCVFSGKQGFRGGNGIQIKGGSHDILVQNNLFRSAGMRTVQIGGLTGRPYFRPSVGDFEAKNVIIAGNTFIGGEAQMAWVTAQNSHVHHNLFYLPEKWLGRILQETKDSQFKRCQRGLFEQNVVVTDQRVNTFFNVGQGTAPETFVFRENLWFRPDGRNRPNLPSFEKDGLYDVDPMIVYSADGSLQVNSAAPELQRIGPAGYQSWVGREFADVKVPAVTIPEVKHSTLDWIEALMK